VTDAAPDSTVEARPVTSLCENNWGAIAALLARRGAALAVARTAWCGKNDRRLFQRLTGRWPQRSKALWLHGRGMTKARVQDHPSAIADDTAVVKMGSAPPDVRSITL